MNIQNTVKEYRMKRFWLGIMIVLAVASCTDAVYASTCRNPAVKHQFDKQQGYPHGRKNYIVDHVCALVCC